MNGHVFVPPEISIIIPPVMRKVRPHQDDVTGMKPFNMITHELRAAALMKIDHLHFRVIMPAVVYEWIPVLPDAEGMSGRLWDF